MTISCLIMPVIIKLWSVIRIVVKSVIIVFRRNTPIIIIWDWSITMCYQATIDLVFSELNTFFDSIFFHCRFKRVTFCRSKLMKNLWMLIRVLCSKNVELVPIIAEISFLTRCIGASYFAIACCDKSIDIHRITKIDHSCETL